MVVVKEVNVFYMYMTESRECFDSVNRPTKKIHLHISKCFCKEKAVRKVNVKECGKEGNYIREMLQC